METTRNDLLEFIRDIQEFPINKELLEFFNSLSIEEKLIFLLKFGYIQSTQALIQMKHIKEIESSTENHSGALVAMHENNGTMRKMIDNNSALIKNVHEQQKAIVEQLRAILHVNCKESKH